MEAIKRFKLYKSGKLWCVAAIAALTLTFGTLAGNATVKADATQATPQTSQTVNQPQTASQAATNQSAAQVAVQPAAASTNATYVANGHYYKNGQLQKNAFYTDNQGRVYYFDAQGNQYQNQWYQNWGHRYYFGNGGVRVTGTGYDGAHLAYRNIDGNVYAFNRDGVAYTGFLNAWGKTYYFAPNGARYTNQWYQNWGHRYYFGSDGTRVSGTGYDGAHLAYRVIDGNTYGFDRNGVAYTGFLSAWGQLYYFDGTGARYTNRWYNNWGHSYFFDGDGVRLTNVTRQISGATYHFDNQGISSLLYGNYNHSQAVRPAQMSDLTSKGVNFINQMKKIRGNVITPISLLGGFDNITVNSGFFNSNANAVHSESQLPLTFEPGILAYDPNGDTSERISQNGLTEAQEQRLNDLSTQWMNSLRNYYWNVLQPQNQYGKRFVSRTHDSRYYRDNTPTGATAIQPLMTTVDFWHNVGEMTAAERTALNFPYQHTIDPSGKYTGRTFNFEGHQQTFADYTGRMRDEIANVYQETPTAKKNGYGFRYSENLYDIQGNTMVQMEVNLYNKMQGMLWGEYFQNANGTVSNGTHLIAALDPQAQLVTMGFQRTNNEGNEPHYYVCWEFYGQTDTNTFGGANSSAARAFGTAWTGKNSTMRTYDGILNTGIVDQIRRA